MRAKHHNCPEALLAAVDTPTAKGIVGNAVSVVEEERPFQPPLLTHSRHFHAPVCHQSITLRQTVKLLISVSFSGFFRLVRALGKGGGMRVWVSPLGAFCALSGGAFAPFLNLKTNCIFFVRCIVFLVQIAYNDSAGRKGMISWLELQQTSASEWTAI